ncbi:MAG: GNAT family N-acetyltransferase [Cyanobacteria bacterium J06621_3]
MPISVRLANTSDIPNLLTLIRLKADFDGCPQSVKATAEKLEATLFSERPMGYVLLAKSASTQASEYSGLPLGFASYHFIYSTFLAQPGLWLDDLFVREGHRNQSIGVQLIQALRDTAKQNNCGRIDWTVDINNAAGIRFYERIGGQLRKNVHLCRLSQP